MEEIIVAYSSFLGCYIVSVWKWLQVRMNCYTEDVGCLFLRTVCDYLPADMRWHPRILHCSTTTLREPKISHDSRHSVYHNILRLLWNLSVYCRFLKLFSLSSALSPVNRMHRLIACSFGIYFNFFSPLCGSRDNSVGIATRYGLNGPGIHSRWSEIFRTCPDRLWGPPSLLYIGYWVSHGGKATGEWRWPPTAN